MEARNLFRHPPRIPSSMARMPRASREYRPCFQFAARQRSSPSAVRDVRAAEAALGPLPAV